MTRKTIHFSKGFLPCAVISAAIIVSGIAGFFIRGINFGLDYRPGLLEEVRIAPAVLDVSYSGSANVSLDMSGEGIDVVISGTGSENKTETLSFAANRTVSDLSLIHI